MRLNFWGLTDMQVNSLIIMAEEASMQLPQATNFKALRDENEPSKIFRGTFKGYCKYILAIL